MSPNRLLRRFGLEVRRLPQAAEQFPAPDDDERRSLEAIIATFAGTCSPDSDCADAQKLRGYLSNARIYLFNNLLDECERHGIVFDRRRIADVGTGMAYLLRLIQQRAPEAVLAGYDTAEEMNGLAKRLCPSASIVRSSLYEIDTQYDIVFCTETLEHLEHPADALLALFDLVSTNGALVLTVPDGRKDQQSCGERREDGSGYWGHIHFWSPESWKLFLDRELGDHARIKTGQCLTGQNYGILFKPAVP